LKKVSFIHTSDIHLGHQQFNLEERFHDFARAFRDVVDYALDKKVDFMVIGGDFFHKRAINAETLRQAMELLQPLKESGIPVICIEGNHDKAFYQDRSSWLKLLNSLGYIRLLKPVVSEGKMAVTDWVPEGDGCVTLVGGIRLIGLGYLGVTTEQRLLEIGEQIEPSHNFTVLVLHAAVNKFLEKDLGGIRKEALDPLREKIDYLALGHIHTREEDGWFYNPGSLENCHIDEAREGREKGFYHVTVTAREKEVLYIPSGPRPVRLISIDISGAEDPEEVYSIVRRSLDALVPETGVRPMVQVILKGEIDFSALAIDTTAISREIKEKGDCLYVEVQNNANLPESDGADPLSETVNRPQIERKVLGQLVRRRFPQYKDCQDDLVNLIVRIKESALAGESPEEIIEEISLIARDLPDLDRDSCGEGEAAASAAGGEDIED